MKAIDVSFAFIHVYYITYIYKFLMITFRHECAMNSLALGTRDGGLKKSLMGPQPSPLCSAHISGIYYIYF